MASGGLASGRGWQGVAPPVSHHEGAWGFGLWQSTWHEGVNEERRRKKNETCYLPLLHVQGKKKEEQCRSKRHCSILYIYFLNMKQRRFRQNVSFHLNMAPTYSFPNQSLIYPLFF
jgi:hypothetical protein